LIKKNSEVKLGVIFRPHTLEKENRMRDRIRKVINTQMQVQAALGKSAPLDPSQVFVSDDEDDDEEDRVNRETSASFTSAQGNLGDIRT